MLTHWDPFNELNRLHSDFDRLLTRQRKELSFRPAVDIHEGEKEYTIEVEVPGIEPGAIEVSVDGQVLTISGERKASETKEGEGYRHVERTFGSFVRRFTLPETVNAEAIVAKTDHGLLRIALPKRDLPKPKKIKVN